jgi:short-subunit dehydrogenase
MSAALKSSKAGAAGEPPYDVDAIRQQAFDIDRQAGDIEILIAAVFDKIDDMVDQTPTGMATITAINCFVTCVLRNAALIREAGINILTLSSKGGEA